MDSGSGGVQTTDARQDHMQDDSGKKLVTDEASKKQKTTGLNHSESGKTSEDKKHDVDESKKRMKSKGKLHIVEKRKDKCVKRIGSICVRVSKGANSQSLGL